MRPATMDAMLDLSEAPPVSDHDDEPPRTSWSDIVMLADGLAPGVLLARAQGEC